MISKKSVLLFILLGTSLFTSLCVRAAPSDDAGAGFALLGILMMCWLPIIVLDIVIMIWVYKDAEKRGESGVLWLLLVFFMSIIGLIIYLIVRPPLKEIKQNDSPIPSADQTYTTDRRCTNCGRIIPTDADICPYCGKRF